MKSQAYKDERTRGLKEGGDRMKLLQETWPKAFPTKGHEVRPLAQGAPKIVAATFGWSPPYAQGVVERWKRRNAYCRAVLAYSKRVALDGSETAEEVDERARSQAQSVLDHRKAKEREAREKAERQVACATSAVADPVPEAVSVRQ